MLIKFFSGGRTYKGAVSAVNYLLNERVEDATAKVLKGDKNTTLNIIKNIENKWKFSSGVVSFEKIVDDEIIKDAMYEFEKTFFSGLNEEQYNILWVEHIDKERTELHFLIPRVELKTWRAFNPYYHQRDLKKKDLLQDYLNKKHNLTSPKIADRLATKHDLKWSNKNNELKKQINEFLEQLIENGIVKTREDIINILKAEKFEITRKSKSFISIKSKEMKRAIRLKGAIYEEDFDVERTTKEQERRIKQFDNTELSEIRKKLDREVANASKYNAYRFKSVQGKDGADVRLSSNRNQNASRDAKQTDRQVYEKDERKRVYPAGSREADPRAEAMEVSPNGDDIRSSIRSSDNSSDSEIYLNSKGEEHGIDIKYYKYCRARFAKYRNKLGEYREQVRIIVAERIGVAIERRREQVTIRISRNRGKIEQLRKHVEFVTKKINVKNDIKIKKKITESLYEIVLNVKKQRLTKNIGKHREKLKGAFGMLLNVKKERLKKEIYKQKQKLKSVHNNAFNIIKSKTKRKNRNNSYRI